MTKSQTNSKVTKVFEYIRHCGPVILLQCMTTSETGLLGFSLVLYEYFKLLQETNQPPLENCVSFIHHCYLLLSVSFHFKSSTVFVISWNAWGDCLWWKDLTVWKSLSCVISNFHMKIRPLCNYWCLGDQIWSLTWILSLTVLPGTRTRKKCQSSTDQETRWMWPHLVAFKSVLY